MARARAGDVQAFNTLVTRHQSRVRQQLRRLTRGDPALADDLAQETFVQAWRALPGFRGDARFATWLYRIAYHRFLMQCRAEPPLQPLGDAAAGPADAAHVSSDALRIDLERALARLPEPERIAIIHCGVLELTHEEAASVLGLPLGTLKSQVARAKARLRIDLAAWQAETCA
nr:sigma-70 family RNA polymerase sigma factor [Aquabacterium terrae]